jgi:hypothetical protein
MVSGVFAGFTSIFGDAVTVIEQIVELPANKRGGQELAEWTTKNAELDVVGQASPSVFRLEAVFVTPVGERAFFLNVNEAEGGLTDGVERVPVHLEGPEHRNFKNQPGAGGNATRTGENANALTGGIELFQRAWGFMKGPDAFNGGGNMARLKKSRHALTDARID